MRQLQHYQGRHYYVVDLIEALASIHGVVTAREWADATLKRYAKTWRCRAVIAALRAEGSTSDHGLGYGPDWKGKLYVNPEDGSRTVAPTKTSYPLKTVLRDFQRDGQVPLKLLKMPTTLIRRRDEEAWIASSVRRNDLAGLAQDQAALEAAE